MTTLHFQQRTLRAGLRLCGGLVASLLFCVCAVASNISFDLSLTGTELTITNKGDGTAFYPAVFRMTADGRWEAMADLSPTPSAEFLAGGNIKRSWPAQPGLDKGPAVLRLQPVMVRFFDQAGVGFGQISFFNQPKESDVAVKVDGFSFGKLVIHPPESGPANKRIHASWLLWPKEDGIEPIKRPVRFEHIQPPAIRIEWTPETKTQYFDVGAGQPATILLHETDDGISIQRIPGGGLQGREQRSPWLNGANLFYGLAVALLLLAAGALVWHGINGIRTRKNKGITQ